MEKRMLALAWSVQISGSSPSDEPSVSKDNKENSWDNEDILEISKDILNSNFPVKLVKENTRSTVSQLGKV